MLRRGLFILLAMIGVVGLGCGDDDDNRKRDAAADARDARTPDVRGTDATPDRAPDAAPGPDGADAVAEAGRDIPAFPPDGPSRDGIDAADVPFAPVDGGVSDGLLDVAMLQDGVARVDGGAVDGGVDAAAVPVCGPFADGGAPVDAGGVAAATMSFFVSSQTSATANLGGLAGADQRCRLLAAAVGVSSANWRAYLSVEHEPPVTGNAVNARDRIGAGPWYNSRGVLVAANLADLHARPGDARVFLDENGAMINGQWTGSPSPVEHDILTGSNPDGTVAFGKTCGDWTSSAPPPDAGVPDGGGGYVARVGHSDGLGPACSMATSPINYTSWNSSHDNAGCNDTAPLGGAGRIYCFKTQ